MPAGGGQGRAVGGERHGVDVVVTAPAISPRNARSEVPDGHCPAGVTSSEQPAGSGSRGDIASAPMAIGTEGEAVNRRPAAREDCLDTPGRERPDGDAAGFITAGHKRVIGRERHAAHLSPMS